MCQFYGIGCHDIFSRFKQETVDFLEEFNFHGLDFVFGKHLVGLLKLSMVYWR